MPSGFVEPARRRTTRFRAAVRRRIVGEREPAIDLNHAGLFDLEFYQAQFAEVDLAPTTVREAIAHYAAHGRESGLSINPFIETEWWAGREDASPERIRRVELALIDRRFHDRSPSPLLADVEEPFGEMVHFVQTAQKARRALTAAGSLSVEQMRRAMIAAVGRAYREAPNEGAHSGTNWGEVLSRVGTRVPGRTSIIIATYEDWSMTVDCVRAALTGSGEDDVEVLVVDNGSRPAVFRLLTAVFLDEPRVRVIRSTLNTNFAGGMNIGIAQSTGEFVLFLNNDAMLEPGWLPPLLERMRDSHVRGVQSLLLYPHSRRVQAAGTMFLGNGVLPWHFLAGHPIEDAVRATNRRFSAITAAVMMLRAADVIGAEGFDEAYLNGYEDVDLCLRLLKDPADHFTVAIESVAIHPEGSSEGRSRHDTANRIRFMRDWRNRLPGPEAWRYGQIGLEMTALRPHSFVDEVPVMLSYPDLVRPRSIVESGPAAGHHCLRWALCLTTMPTDESLVTRLRERLEALGQEVVSFAGGVEYIDGIDDVLVAFAADAPYTPRSAAFNVLVGAEAGERAMLWDAVLGTVPNDESLEGSGEGDGGQDALLRLISQAADARSRRFAHTTPTTDG